MIYKSNRTKIYLSVIIFLKSIVRKIKTMPEQYSLWLLPPPEHYEYLQKAIGELSQQNG